MAKKLLLIVLFAFLISACYIDKKFDRPETKIEIVKRLVKPELYEIVCSVIEVESGWNELAISPSGDYGLMQINKSVWNRFFDWSRILEVEYNIMSGLFVLDKCLEKSNGDIERALYYYNGSIKYPAKIFKKQGELFNETSNKL